MSSAWYCTRDGKNRFGPFTSSQLRKLTKSGKLLPTDMVWKQGMTQWVRANQINGLVFGIARQSNVGQEQMTALQTYNAINDIGGFLVNVRLRDNLLQGLAIFICVIIGGVAGCIVGKDVMGGFVGAFIGLVVGFLVSGFFLMIYRAIQHARGYHD
jgi:hypothetical protein